MNRESIRVLLVEDNPADARLFSESVREAGNGQLKLEISPSLPSALERLARGSFDVLVLDLVPAGQAGLEKIATTHAHAPQIPIVVLIGQGDETLAAKALRSGAQDYLVKKRLSGDLLVRSLRYVVERVRTVEALERREQHYRSLIENSLDLIMIVNNDGTIRYASPSHERILGYRSDELIGQSIRQFVHPEDLASVQAAMESGGDIAALEVRVRHKDGSWRVLESYQRNLSHVPGVNGLVVNAREVTERKRLEEQLHHSQRLEAVGRLAGGIAHDFNNLLMIINGYSRMLLDTIRPGDPARPDLEQVVKASERANELTRQLLAFSRRQVVKPALLNLNTLVHDMDRMLRRVLGEDIELLTVLAPELKTVRADPGQLEQVVLNVAVNARDAMPGGGKLTLETANREGGVVLSVTDTGIGMDPQVLAHVFEPFFTTKEHGTGLGLSTSYGIIQQSGGDIRVDSTPSLGTTFRISLPAVERTSAEEPASEPGRPLRGTETILLVEDEEGVRRVLETMLRRHGYQVLSAGSSSSATAAADKHKGVIHLLVTDVVMPGMSGRKMAECLIQRRPEMRVLYVSGYGDASESGAPFLQKPFSTQELALKIREVLSRAGASSV
ncbi:MAG TPA: response regulator [Bryobacteraceae bacterium]|nr:response regulator [Bryobacteraceae bacterium]